MLTWLNYGYRATAAGYLLCWVLIATHAIGEPASTAPITWTDAWKLVVVIAAAIFLGWQAGRESKAPQ